jgi:hypothetical protein
MLEEGEMAVHRERAAAGGWLAGIPAGIALMACSVVGLVPASVSAAEPSLVVSPTEYSRGVPKHVQIDIDAAVSEALAGLSTESIDAREAFGCRNLACALREAREQKLGSVIVVRVEMDDRDFHIVVEARAASDGRVEFKNEELCELCGHHELLAVVTAQVRKLGRLLERGSGPPMLLVRGSPSHAAVVLDGQQLGVAPLELEVQPGPHLVELQAPGYAAQSHRWRARKGIEEVVDFKLSTTRLHRRGARIGGWVGFALGVAGLGIGGVLIASDGLEHGPSCPIDLRDANGNCPNVYTTKVAGIVAAGAGGAALVTGISLLIHAAPKDRRNRNADKRSDQAVLEIAPRPGGVLLRF